MKVLLDTHVLIWNATDPKRLSGRMRKLMEDKDTELYFSVISLWEIEVKRGLKRPDFVIEPRLLRRALLEQEYQELSLTAEHIFALEKLPLLHRDPFDRCLLCQAQVERMTLITDDSILKKYPGPILFT